MTTEIKLTFEDLMIASQVADQAYDEQRAAGRDHLRASHVAGSVYERVLDSIRNGARTIVEYQDALARRVAEQHAVRP